MILKIKRFLKRLSLRYQLLLNYLTVFFVVFLLIGLVNYLIIRATVQRNIENELSNSTKTIHNMVSAAVDTSIRNYLRSIAEKNLNIAKWVYQEFLNGNMSEEAAKKFAANIFLSQKIGKSGYIYALDSRGIIRVHPKEKLLNKSLLKYKFIQQQIARKQGYLEYDWANPGEKKKRPKAVYMAYFAPWDWIISVSSYRREFKDLVNVADFRAYILGIQFGKTGYPYVMDSAGNLIIHPKLEGQNIYSYRDEDGRMFIKEICEKKHGSIIYPWKNPGDPKARDKLVYYSYLPELDWIIASSGYLEEFYKPMRDITYSLLVSLCLTIIFLIPMSWFLSSRIVSPLNRLTMAFQKGSEGDYSMRIQVGSEDEIGQLEKYYNMFMDQLQWSRAKLIESEEKYRSIFENAVEGMFQTTPDGRIISANNALAYLLGYRSEEELKTEVTDLEKQLYLKEEDRVEFKRILKEKGIVVGFETQFKRKEGEEISVALSARQVVDSNTNTVFYEGSIVDMTEKKKREKAEQRRQAVEAENKAKNQFLGMVVHDLRNPILIIREYADFLRSNDAVDISTEDKLRFLGVIYESSEFMNNLVEDLLTIAAVQSAKVQLKLDEVDYISLIRKNVELNQVLASKKQISIEVQAEQQVLCLTIDNSRIAQVLNNLISNAIKYSHAKTKVIVLVSQKEKHILTQVCDQGQGIPKKEIEYVFEPFKKTSSVPTAGESSTGLGLAIAKKIVELHKGKIWVEAKEKQGTTFSFTLPINTTE